MNILSELLNLRASITEAEKVETKTAEEVWGEGDPKTYVSSTIFSIRQKDDGNYEVTIEKNATRSVVSKNVSDAYVKSNFTALSNKAAPDVEGYVRYRSSEQFEAVQYNGPTIKLMNDKVKTDLEKGDYLIKAEEGDNFVYKVVREGDFEAEYEEK